MIRSDNKEIEPVDHRVAAGWLCYRKWAHILESRASIQDRLRFWEKTVLRSLLWGLASLRCENYVSDRLACTQRSMFRKMLRLKRRPDTDGSPEPWLEWQIRSLGQAKALVDVHSCNIVNTFLETRTNWAQHIARFGSTASKPQHMLKAVMCWRSRGWQHEQNFFNDLNWDPIRQATAGQPHRWENSWCADWLEKFSVPAVSMS